MRAAAKRRRPVLVNDELRIALVLDVDHHETGIAPRAIGNVVVDHRVVQAVAAGRKRPIRHLAGGEVHARQPVSADDRGLGRVGHVDGDEDVVREALHHRRGIGPAAADVPDAVQPGALDRHEADLTGLGRLGDVEDRHAGRPVARLRRRVVVVAPGLGLVVVALVRHLRLREHVPAVHQKQQVVVHLQVQAPGVRRVLDVIHRLRPASGRARRRR